MQAGAAPAFSSSREDGQTLKAAVAAAAAAAACDAAFRHVRCVDVVIASRALRRLTDRWPRCSLRTTLAVAKKAPPYGCSSCSLLYRRCSALGLYGQARVRVANPIAAAAAVLFLPRCNFRGAAAAAMPGGRSVHRQDYG